MNGFESKMAAQGLKFCRARLQKLQIKVGRKCNQARRDCYFDGDPRV
jgi:hypothetical protein